MKRELLLSTLLLGVTLLSGSAHASLVNMDWKVPGDSAVSKDTSTNLGWLDLTMTKGMSFNQVLAQTTAGGTFFGFRLPTTAEVFQLMSNLSGQPMSVQSGESKAVNVPVEPTSFDGVRYLSNGHVPMLGVTRRQASAVSSNAYFLDDFGGVYYSNITQRTFSGSDVNYVINGTSYNYSIGSLAVASGMDTASTFYGIFLVKDLSNPEPNDVSAPWSGAALAAIFLMGLRRLRRPM